jgi:hypothetical protein
MNFRGPRFTRAGLCVLAGYSAFGTFWYLVGAILRGRAVRCSQLVDGIERIAPTNRLSQ